MGVPGASSPVLDLKPLSYNPFLDGTVVYENAGGVLVPTSTSSSPPPLGNALLDNRPSNASTQALVDSARSTTRTGVVIDDVALRGYRNAFGGLETERFSRAVDNMTDHQLDDFIQSVTDDLAASRANQAATLPRITANQALRRGTQFAGAVGTAIDLYNVADAIVDPTNNPADEIGDIAGSMVGGALGSTLGPVGALGGSLVGGWLGRQLGGLLFQGEQREPNYELTGVIWGVRSYNHRRQAYTIWALEMGEPPASMSFHTCEYSGGTEYCHVKVTGVSGREIWDSSSTGTRAGSGRYIVFKDKETSEQIADPKAVGSPSIEYPRLDAPLPSGKPLPAPTSDQLPAPTGGPALDAPPNPTSEPLPTSDQLPSPGGPVLDAPPKPDDLPEPRPTPVADGPRGNPNPALGCCDLTALHIEQLLREVEAIKTHFQTSGFATLDMPTCGDTAPYLLPWSGSGLTGIYDALETLSEATNRLWAQVQCPPDATAAVPMAWDIKVHEHPQLIVPGSKQVCVS